MAVIQGGVGGAKSPPEAVPFDSVYITGSKNKISSKQSLLIIPIVKFFNNPENMKQLIGLLNGEIYGTELQASSSAISLRLVDWFVTNYCKKYNIMYNKNIYKKRTGVLSNQFENYFFVHDNYKSQLKECSKNNFDPFCRRERVRFYYKPNTYFLTTVGQLNFFKWALEHYVIDYIRDNLNSIELDMNEALLTYSKQDRKATKKKRYPPASSDVATSPADELKPRTKSHKISLTRNKRKELSSMKNKSYTKYSIPTVLTFE